jgi:small basic protein
MKPLSVFVLGAAILIVLGVIAEFAVPDSARVIDIGAAVFAAATWIVPPLRVATHKSKKPGSSLAAVGFTIHVVLLAAVLSAVGLVLAVLTLVFAGGGDWAWRSILAIVAFWVAGFALIANGRRSQPAKADQPPP